MKRLAILAPVLLLLAGCAGSPEPAASAADPLVTCIDVNVEYGLAESRTEASDQCVWLQEREYEALFNGVADTFAKTFGDLDSAREWAKAEATKAG